MFAFKGIPAIGIDIETATIIDVYKSQLQSLKSLNYRHSNFTIKENKYKITGAKNISSLALQ